MNIDQLARLDLNLLVTLHLLLEERQVSRVAERLHLTQSTVSKALGRLRQALDDPLFTRSPQGLTPTPKALAMAEPLAHWLRGADKLLLPQGFDSRHYQGQFRLALGEYLGVAIMPTLVSRLALEAPGVRLSAAAHEANPLKQLADGELDFAVQLQRQHYGPGFEVTSLGAMQPCLLMRSDHPLTEQATVQWEGFVRYPQVRLLVGDFRKLQFWQQDARLAEYERQLHFVLETSHLMTAIEVLLRTDAIMLGPPLLAVSPQLRQLLAARQIPSADAEPLNTLMRYVLVQHQRTAGSGPHSWLRSQLLGACAELKFR
ncbi:LysR substrate-binding domain-containing protein [Simiduia sp. 21SJ11W-1]|uniref:LysR family transcriptional regulator n=1 Tax=Simiduia sp. 21SJ11W-1 TaxID=2909669 RepID=UPI0020A003B3|nr:LysR substrate-binding domain-containing protein [Simiduia sp. 21SJ11W-1]UTA48532.1 LysR substrate-binding domain-containing protein [Simiduia sp. 21SJ11W-1]